MPKQKVPSRNKVPELHEQVFSEERTAQVKNLEQKADLVKDDAKRTPPTKDEEEEGTEGGWSTKEEEEEEEGGLHLQELEGIVHVQKWFKLIYMLINMIWLLTSSFSV